MARAGPERGTGGGAKGISATGRGEGGTTADAHAISVVTQIVPVTCSVIGADGVAVRGLRIEDFTVKNVPARLGKIGDLWKPLLEEKNRVDLKAFL